MKITTPFDFWKAGFEVWLTTWEAQIALGERLLFGMTAWRQILDESAERPLPEAGMNPVRRARRRA